MQKRRDVAALNGSSKEQGDQISGTPRGKSPAPNQLPKIANQLKLLRLECTVYESR